jgi:hypothetical protein
MLDKETIRMARKRAEESRRNPVRITKEHWDGADKLLKEHEAFESSKDKDIERECQALAKDVAGFTYNQVVGIGKLFNGLGEGKAKSITCQFPGCGIHEGSMFNMTDGKWYCSHHKSFGNLTEPQKEKELGLCLQTKQEP